VVSATVGVKLPIALVAITEAVPFAFVRLYPLFRNWRRSGLEHRKGWPPAAAAGRTTHTAVTL